MQLIEKALKEEKSSIMLVPEISLTPQTVDRFIARFGEEKIAVLHSKLSVGERYDQWNKIRQGKAKELSLLMKNTIVLISQKQVLDIMQKKWQDI